MKEKDFEKFSEVEIAYKILDASGKDNPIYYKDLILEVIDKKKKTVQNGAAVISEIYTMINMDSRFQHVGDGKWGLTEWNPPEVKRTRGGRTKTAAAKTGDVSE